MKNLFSERYKYKELKQLRPDEMSENLKKRIWNFFQKSLDSDKIEIIWDKFFKEDLNELKRYWREDYK